MKANSLTLLLVAALVAVQVSISLCVEGFGHVTGSAGVVAKTKVSSEVRFVKQRVRATAAEALDVLISENYGPAKDIVDIANVIKGIAANERPKNACWKDSYGRGAGKPLSNCPAGTEWGGVHIFAPLCYPPCDANYEAMIVPPGVGVPTCMSKCPNGFSDIGYACHKGASNYLNACPPGTIGMQDSNAGNAIGGFFTEVFSGSCAKTSYVRKDARMLGCSENEEIGGLLCYPPCKNGYVGIGPVCWESCLPDLPYDCGGAMCTKDAKECSGKIWSISKNIFSTIGHAVAADPLGATSSAIKLAKDFILSKCHP